MARGGIEYSLSRLCAAQRLGPVMLNKGLHIDLAVRILDDILTRMDAHQSKKRAMLRSLRLAADFDGLTAVVPPRS